ncbi:hypothetical protein C8R44DRAFT_821564 [Mycena epipterygia]|nr:hypothetical protein C8R44DRAFT_821564 [Mycena epipterygia]
MPWASLLSMLLKNTLRSGSTPVSSTLIQPRCPALPQELWNHILTFLRGYNADLTACSFVSRSLCAASQSHIFYSIAIFPSGKARQVGSRSGPDDATDEVASCRRLRVILTESSHLLPHIRRIEMRLHPEVITEVLAMGLPRLEELHFHTRGFVPNLEDNARIKLAHRLMTLPTVRHVGLGGSVQTREFLSSFFAGTPQQLQTLEISTTWLSQSDDQPPARTRQRIRNLLLLYSPEMAPWLLDAACPFDLTHLTHANISSSMCPHVARILNNTRCSLQSLTLAPDDVRKYVALSIFPSLTEVHFDAPTQRGIAGILPLLETLDPANGVRDITITLATFGEQPKQRELKMALRAFDAAFDDIHLPALRRVEIQVLSIAETGEPHESRRLMYMHSLPVLRQRGVLVVEIQ